MYAVQRLSSYISHGVYTVSGPFHPFGGAVDIIVVQQQDGSFKSSPWYVRFGKFQGVLKTKEKVVDICVNGIEAGFHMYLDHKGEAFFLREIDVDDADGTFSPFSSGDETDERLQNGRLVKAQSLNLDGIKSNSATQIDIDSKKVVKRTSSQPPSLLGLVFGRRSMKEESSRRMGGGDKVRISMSEVVDMAGEILDANGLTNSPADHKRSNDASPVFGDVKPPEEGDEHVQDSEIEDLHNPSMLDVVHHDFIQHDLHETVATDGSSGVSIIDTDCLVEAQCPTYSYLHIHEQDQRMLTSGMSELSSEYAETCKKSSCDVEEVSRVDNADCEITDQLTSEVTFNDSQGPSCADLEEGSTIISNISRQYDERLVSNERDSFLTEHVSHEESNETCVSSYVCSNMSAGTRVEIDGQHEKVEIHTQVLYNAAELMSENDSRPESGIYLGENGSDGMPHNPKSSGQSDANFEDSTTKGIQDGQMKTDSLSSHGGDMLNSDSVKLNTVEVVLKDSVLIKEEKMESGQVETFEDQSHAIDRSSPSSYNIKVGEQNAACESLDKPVGDAEGALVLESMKGDTNLVCTMSNLSNLVHLVQEEEVFSQGSLMHNLELPSEAPFSSRESNSISIVEEVVTSRMRSSENLEEDDYLFRDIDNPAVGVCPWDEMGSPASGEEADGLMINDTEEEHEFNNMNYNSRLSFGSRSYSTAGSHASELMLESSSTAPTGSPQELGLQTSPISIPKSRLHEEGIGSVPNFPGYMDDLGGYDVLHPLSRSLDSSSKMSICDLNRKTLISKAASESNLVKHQPSAESVADSKNKKVEECLPINHPVEISLCKHLLFEGMGADAASQAFDAEQIDLEKFRSAGPSVMKNDKLVVRINGHYFPWNVAAPIVLGMVCFGNKQIVELKGMIPVERKEKDIEGEATVSSSGSWRLWTFFRKSKGDSSTQSPSSGNKGTEADNNLLESASNISGHKNLHEGSRRKKLVRSILPTSEQLASLDLKEGRNVVTFTFSTAMLGRQQVDARIYLWKWNTRIVISDVDGTITKSDVLGQFMPLVGKDWSHLGVAHLFSAIKENGYQLLFLSARAISQAYLTRQFLVNLKQDGKALPDGPVVISPDGLFPSLYREVIRRAPHEFKIACLEDIRALFPPDCNPFYAGFGNRDTDEISYLKVGIPKGKIFIINPKGEVAVNRWVDTKSYSSLHSLVNGIFPAMSSEEQEDFNSWNFWKMPLPDINI